MIYRRFTIDRGNQILDQLDALGINWQIWNVEDVFLGGAEYMEIGVENWSIVNLEENVMIPETEFDWPEEFDLGGEAGGA